MAFLCGLLISFFSVRFSEGVLSAHSSARLLPWAFSRGIPRAFSLMDGFHRVLRRVVFSALSRGDLLVHFSPGLSPCTLWQRKFPWAISYGCFRALFCSRLLCALSCRGLFRALFLRALIPRTLLQQQFPRVHRRWIFRTLL